MSISSIIHQLSKRSDVTLHEGASENLISNVEHALNIKLPDDVQMFYRLTNGFETDEYLFNIIRLEEIIENELKWKSSQFYVAEYLIYSDTWEINVNPANRNDYNICNVNRFSEKIILTKSFEEFLQRILEGGVFSANGLLYWGEELRLKSSTR